MIDVSLKLSPKQQLVYGKQYSKNYESEAPRVLVKTQSQGPTSNLPSQNCYDWEPRICIYSENSYALRINSLMLEKATSLYSMAYIQFNERTK